ncbi:MAG: PQQ-dependent sugar dehydrogenase [Chloroflexota bacterium]
MSSKSGGLAVRAIVLALAVVLALGDGGLVPAPHTSVAAPLSAPDNSLLLQPFLTGLSGPVLLTNAGDGSGRLFIVESGGKIKIVKNGVVNQTPFLDVSSIIVAGGEQGLLGLAFHPQFASNGRFFVFYTAKPPPNQPADPPPDVGSNTLAEYHATPGSDVADSTPTRVLLSLYDRFPNHNGGMLAFGPDHYLYVGTGDEGSGGGPDNHSQDLNSLFGKLLRLDVDTPGTPQPPGAFYSIPRDNPFFDDTNPPPNIRQEIFALGFRNPWRWSFDRQTGDLWIGDVGQSAWEEVDFLPYVAHNPPARNLGWNIREGAHCYPPGTPSCPTSGLVDPVLEYPHPPGTPPQDCAVTGGYRYRGTKPENAELRGIYFYADFCTGRIWKGVQSGSTWRSIEALDTDLNISAFGEDESGELYVVGFGGQIMRLAQGTFTTCSQAGRPRVAVQTVASGPGRLTVNVGVTDNANTPNNELKSIAFTRIANAAVTIGTQVDKRTPFSVPFPAGARSTSFTVKRDAPGPIHVDLSITDACGPWTTFVGAGASLP